MKSTLIKTCSKRLRAYSVFKLSHLFVITTVVGAFLGGYIWRSVTPGKHDLTETKRRILDSQLRIPTEPILNSVTGEVVQLSGERVAVSLGCDDGVWETHALYFQGRCISSKPEKLDDNWSIWNCGDHRLRVGEDVTAKPRHKSLGSR